MPDQKTAQAVGRTAAAIPACILAWVLPGAGHLFLGRTTKGLAFLGCIGVMFGLGVAMDARLQFYFGFDDPLALLRSTAQMAIGIPYFLARGLGFQVGDVTSVFHEYGNTFTEVAGLLNVLIILDAHDTARGLRP